MSQMFTGSIDLTKIDKQKLVVCDKKGNPFKNGAVYVNVVVFVNDEQDSYGNIASIQQSLSLEERERGMKATYIGNLKTIEKGQNKTKTTEVKPFSNNPLQDLLG